MTRVVALQAWSNGSITMEEKQIADLQDALAAELIAQGIVAPTALPAITTADAGKVLTANDSGEWVASLPASGGGVLVVHVTWDDNFTGTLDKTWQEIHDGGFGVIVDEDDETPTSINQMPITFVGQLSADTYDVMSIKDDGSYGFKAMVFRTDSVNGYPVFLEP